MTEQFIARLSVSVRGRICFSFLLALACSLYSVQADSLLEGFKSHTHPIGPLYTSDQLVAEGATYTTHNKHKIRKSMPSARFKPAIPSVKLAADLRAGAHKRQDWLCRIISA